MDNIRYVKLKNKGAFVAQIHIEYKIPKTDGQGNISYPAEFTEWKSPNYADICAAAERTVDLASDLMVPAGDKGAGNAQLPDGTVVKLKVRVPGGYTREASEQYLFQKDSGKMASYEIGGTTLTSKLRLLAYQ